MKFRILEAEALLWRGMYPEVVRLLDSLPAPATPPDATVQILTLKGIAHARQHEFSEVEQELAEAERLCAKTRLPSCGKVSQGRGLVALGRNQYPVAQEFLEHSLAFARANNDRFLEATSLLNLGAISLKEGHFDQALDWSNDAYKLSTDLNSRDIAQVAMLNVGWAYYKLGDSERALALALETASHAHQLGDSFNEGNGLTNAGYVYMERRDFPSAEKSFRGAFDLAYAEHDKEHMFNALRVLARLAVQTGNLDKATENAEHAIDIARQSNNQSDELYPLLVQGQIAARRGNTVEAERIFQEVEGSKFCSISLKWESQHSLAQLYEDGNNPDAADREYRAALATFEAARADIRRQDSHLSFLTNGWPIYDDYIHFLVAYGKADEALRWADHSRARTLAEGLGILRGDVASGLPALRAQEIARGAGATILFYWLGEKQSYLWAISAKGTRLITLPPGAEVEAVVQRYRKTLLGPQDALADEDGRWLYRTLVAPAQSSITKDTRVVIIPDGSLNYLNFETLLVGDPSPHFWIEDATITNASSLRMLDSPFQSNGSHRSLLLIGNTVAPNSQYPELPNAAAQMESVARHFPPEQERIFAREHANTQAYVGSNPEHFSHIHFVAHGISSRLSPLDSAIVLSKSGTDSDSFKLYGRDIIQHPLRADLVTISACYGAGERWYSGEGLVGLSWAFLRAGAHNVIAALWEVSDASVEKLMAKFYEELDRGSSPDKALRAAKLSLLQSNEFRKPFYWAPFQLYTQGRPTTSRRTAIAMSAGKPVPSSSNANH